MELAFLIGLLSALHCFGMCGGIVGALTMSLHPDKRQGTISLLQYTLAYNLGRLLSYVLAGLIVGVLGQAILSIIPDVGGMLLRPLLMIFVILLGFYIGGWLPRLSLIEKLGQPIWRILQPIGIKYLPVQKVHHAFMFGLIWGWLPCGLVYYALVMAFAQNGMLDSILFMLFFGLGTLSPMLFAGVLAGKLVAIQKSTNIRKFNALTLILIGVIGLLMYLLPELTQGLYFGTSL
ncbi:MAG: sulfite exporter TauE/SafE family protein [Cocleimonas sp.]|nr:sulfite exporter TauE/SafE family protein [Cocleimonas sp.]